MAQACRAPGTTGAAALRYGARQCSLAQGLAIITGAYRDHTGSLLIEGATRLHMRSWLTIAHNEDVWECIPICLGGLSDFLNLRVIKSLLNASHESPEFGE